MFAIEKPMTHLTSTSIDAAHHFFPYLIPKKKSPTMEETMIGLDERWAN